MRSSIGKPKSRWVYNIKMDTRQVGRHGLVYVTQDRGQWHSLVTKWWNFEVYKKMHFLTGGAIIGFSRSYFKIAFTQQVVGETKAWALHSIVFAPSLCVRHHSDSEAHRLVRLKYGFDKIKAFWEEIIENHGAGVVSSVMADSCVRFVVVYNALSTIIIIFIPLFIFFASLVVHTYVTPLELCGN